MASVTRKTMRNMERNGYLKKDFNYAQKLDEIRSLRFWGFTVNPKRMFKWIFTAEYRRLFN